MAPFAPLRPRPLSICLAGLLVMTAACSQPTAPPAKSVATEPPGAARDGTPMGGRQTRAPVTDADDAPLVVPPLPDGTPEQLLEFVTALRSPKRNPASREELVGYIKGVCARGIEAAERIMDRATADDPNAVKAGRLKLESLMMLADVVEEEKAAQAVTDYAQSLADGPTPALARLGRRMLIMTAGRKAFSSENFDAIPGLVGQVADLLAADPDDMESVQLADVLARTAERVEIPGRPSPAIAAYETFGPLLQKSTVPEIRKLGERMPATTRRLRLPGTPMQIEGTRLDGKAFDPKQFAGKVVLVDFWATWCGPCVEEIPNIRAQYDRYHDRGFEVLAISLDESREELEAFVAEQKLPWPVLFSGKAFDDPVARLYGISGIPQLILIGRDGNVVSVAARGPRLAELLAGQFKDAATDDAERQPGGTPAPAGDTPAAGAER